MKIGQVIYLSSSGCSLWCWNGTRFIESPVATAVGVEPLAVVREAARWPGAAVGVLVDMIDEEHVRDVVPRMSRKDQRAVLARKLARAFPRTVYRNAGIQARNPANPDEDCVLLSALTRSEPVRVLVDLLNAAQIPPAVILSPALLAARLLDEQARSAAAALLVLRRSNGRLQHSFFRHGRLCGSRRLRPGDGVVGNIDAWVRQIEESLRYFDATFSPGPDNLLRILVPAGEFAFLGDGSTLAAGWELDSIDTAARCRRLRISPDVDVTASEQICIELMRSHAGPDNYAPSDLQQRYRSFRARAATRAACIGLALFGVVATLYNGLTIADTRQRVASLSIAAGALEEVLPADSGTLPSEIDPLHMRQVVTTYEALRGGHDDPQRIIAAVSAALSERPLIRVDAIRWGTTVSDGEPDGAMPETDGEPGEAMPAAAVPIKVVIRGHIEPFDGDFRAAFAELQRFITALDRQPIIEQVTARAAPLDVDPRSTLTGEFTPGAVAPQAPFTLELSVRSVDEAV